MAELVKDLVLVSLGMGIGVVLMCIAQVSKMADEEMEEMRTSINEYGNPHTSVDEDMRSRLEAKLIEQVLNFKVA